MKALVIDSEAAYEKSFGGLFYVFLRALGRDDDESHRRVFRAAGLGRHLAVRGRAQTIRPRSGKGRP